MDFLGTLGQMQAVFPVPLSDSIISSAIVCFGFGTDQKKKTFLPERLFYAAVRLPRPYDGPDW